MSQEVSAKPLTGYPVLTEVLPEPKLSLSNDPHRPRKTFLCGNNPVAAAKIVLVISVTLLFLTMFQLYDTGYGLLITFFMVFDLRCIFAPTAVLLRAQYWLAIAGALGILLWIVLLVGFAISSGELVIGEKPLTAIEFAASIVMAVLGAAWCVYDSFIFKEASLRLREDENSTSSRIQLHHPETLTVV